MSREFEFEANDETGRTTLEIISEAQRFNRWMYSTVKPFFKGTVLEIGSGIGNMSQFVMDDGLELFLTDIREGYCSRLNTKFESHPKFLGAKIMNLTDPDFDLKFGSQFEQYDTVFALNVIEHIYDDTLALANCHKLLKKDGQLIILVPSYQKLYNTFDTKLGHYRRYTIASLSKIFLDTGFDIQHKQYFNFMGILGWFVTGSLFKRSSIPSDQMRLYNWFVPFFKIIDWFIFNSIGLSTIVVGKKDSKV